MAQEHQEYIQQKVNPILENLVTQLLLERPEHLAPFMIKWLSDHAKSPAAAALTEGVKEVNELKAELEQLQEEVMKLEGNLGDDTIKTTGTDNQEEEAEEEEDEDDDDGPAEMPPPPDYLTRGPRPSVSAEAYGQWNKPQAFEPPVHSKSEEQKGRILAVLQDSFMFASLLPKEKEIVADAMQEKIFEAGDRIIEQGDDGEAMFVVEEGQVNCYKRQPEGEDKLVKQCRAGDAFGELALLYNCPRAASVKSHERSVLWQLDRETFSHIVRGSANKRRERYEDFLKKVPVLKTMESYELSLLCDALQTTDVKQGSTIVSQGDAGDMFFILEEGECNALKVYAPGTPAQEVMKYRSGDYFGELSLLSNEPRAATVVACTDCRLLTLSRKTFKSLLGPLEDILKRHASQYK
jgi:cAMP-dependent protein kinase regulator